jgi:hypothetical protein
MTKLICVISASSWFYLKNKLSQCITKTNMTRNQKPLNSEQFQTTIFETLKIIALLQFLPSLSNGFKNSNSFSWFMIM